MRLYDSRTYLVRGLIVSRRRRMLLVLVLLSGLWSAACAPWDVARIQVYAQSSDTYVSMNGNDDNSCTSPLSPCRTIQAAINKTPSGGTVHVAAGTYTENIEMKSGVNVNGAGPTDTSIVGGASTSGVVLFSSVVNAKLQGFRITVDEPVPGVDRAVVFSGSSGGTAVLQNNIIQNTQYGIFVWAPSTPTIENNTLVGGPDEQGIYVGNSATAPVIRNNIISGYSFAGIHVVAGAVSPMPIIAYNDLWDNGENYRNYPDQTGINGNIAADPAFVNAASNDFHLRSTPTLSPAIDAGDPSSDYANEPEPNGGRINMGAYGNTSEAATSSYVCYSGLPSPSVSLAGADIESGGVRYWLTVENWNAYPDDLFVPAPDLPPCGLNTNASRTWVDIFDSGDDSRINGYCGLDASADMERLWTFVRDDATPPESVYLVVWDRSCSEQYVSNMVDIPPSPLTCYTLTTNLNPSTGGSVNLSPQPNCGGDTYLENTDVQLTASPSSGYTFDGWSGDASGLNNPVSIVMNGNKSITANFSEISPTCYSLTLTHSGSGSDPVATPAKSASCASDGQYVAGEAIS
ncbi:MAG: NosD domain-containing protein, partial [Anaerolineae bacterium]